MPRLQAEELDSQQGGLQLLENEMARVSASVGRLAGQEKRVIRLYGMGHVTEDYLKTEARQVRTPREDRTDHVHNSTSKKSAWHCRRFKTELLQARMVHGFKEPYLRI